VGLRPYTDAERDYFFARERDERVVSANLRASRLTILYGSTGAGKTSLLLAGVVPRLQDGKQLVLLFRDWQDPSFLANLKRGCADVARAAGRTLDEALPLDELLFDARRSTGMPVLVVLDQFDEYFTAHPAAADGDGFEPELARAINRDDVDAGFLISIREDALAGLDRFHARVPNLLGNLIRLERLRPADAERAIREPLRVYNEQHGTDIAVGSGLVEAVTRDVRVGDGAAQFAPLTAGEDAEDAIDAPFMQLVLERLWQIDRPETSGELRLATYERLGRAEGIAGDHFAAILGGLTRAQRELCARFLDRLVTPSGGKIAYPLSDLENVAGELRPEVPATLEALKRARILREVDRPGYRAVEISHDVLAPKIVEWQQDLVRDRERAERHRKLRRRGAWLVLAAILVAVALIVRHDRVSGLPWAALTSVETGHAYPLKGDQTIVGRDTPGYKAADVSVATRYVSRLHVMIYRDHRVIDVRSMNGTTVNARFLRYGVTTAKLDDGAILVLGGAAVFSFRSLERPYWQVWQPAIENQHKAGGWALFVDGGRRAVYRLHAKRYWVSVAGSGFRLSPRPVPGASAEVLEHDGQPVFQDLPGGAHPVVQYAKQNGESYPASRLADGERRTAPGYVFQISGRSLQLVPAKQ
jgi:hypothetical protein